MKKGISFFPKPFLFIHAKFFSSFKALIFTNSIESAHQLTLVLKQLGLNSVAEISSDMKSKRSKIINMFKSEKANNKIDFLVSTDALARGIDIGTIDFVISYDSPKYIKTYIHR